MPAVNDNYSMQLSDGSLTIGGALPVYQANRFVTTSATGSGSGTSEVDAWTAEQAMTSVVPGNTVRIGPGDYTTAGTGLRYLPAWQPTSSGVSDSQRVTFFAQNRAGLTYQPGVTTRLNHSGVGPIFGGFGKSYVTWDGFMVDNSISTDSEDSGAVVMWGGSNNKVLSCVILGALSTWPPGNNHSGIRIEDTNDCEASDNYISNILGPVGNHSANTTGFHIYSSRRILVHHNTILASTGLRVKEEQNQTMYGHQIHHNFIDTAGSINAGNQGKGILVDETQTTEETWVYQNIITCSSASRTSDGLGHLGRTGFQPNAVKFFNNTIYNADYARWTPPGLPVQTQHHNNLFVDVNNVWFDDWFHTISELTANNLGPNDYNLYLYNGAYTTSTTSWTFAQHQANGSELNSVHQPPLTGAGGVNFVDAGASDFRLAANSVALNRGVDIYNLLGNGTSALINQGAFILPNQSDQIGRRTA